MQINWGLLQGAPNIGESFQSGLMTAQRNALAGQELGMRRQAIERENALRQGLMSAYDPATGAVDPQRMRAAYAGAGDIPGAMAFDAQRAQQQQQITEAEREQIVTGARIIRQINPRDEAGWQQVIAAARQAGVDTANVPPAYDPQYVQSVLAAAEAIEPTRTPNGPNIQREVEYYRSIGRDDLALQLLERHAEGPPLTARNEDGTFTIIPQSVIRGQPQADDDEWEYEGGPSQSGSGNFP